MSKKKLLILTDWYEPGFKAGGPIQSCKNFVDAMYNEFDIVVITTDKDLGELKSYEGLTPNRWTTRNPGIPVYYAEAKTLNSNKLLALIKEIEPNFIYLNSMYSYRFSVIPLWLKWQKKISSGIVLAPRGMLMEGAMQFKTAKKKAFIRLLNIFGLSSKIKFHATDDQELKDIKRYFPKAKSILEISNFSAPLPAEITGIEKIRGRLKLIYISRISPKKNILFFLELLNKIPGDIRLDFDIYGEVEDVSYWEQIEKSIQALPGNIHVEYHGAIPHDKVIPALGLSHIFVLPSKGENYGHAIFEAWSASRPCLISDKTPWRQLSKELAGWDLSLDNSQAWLTVLNEAAEWDQDSFDSWSRNSRSFAERHVGQLNLKEAYLKLFI